jgi:hypothetical protein
MQKVFRKVFTLKSCQPCRTNCASMSTVSKPSTWIKTSKSTRKLSKNIRFHKSILAGSFGGPQHWAQTLNQNAVRSISGPAQTVDTNPNAKMMEDISHIDSVNALVERSCVKYADKPAFGTLVGDKYEWITYRDFGQRIQQFRNVLTLHEIKKNDKGALISNNRVEWAVAMYAISSIGAQLVPM